MSTATFLSMPDGRRIAHRFTPGNGPCFIFLPGYMSDMAGSKATALFDWTTRAGFPCLLLDYSGCGESPGDFGDGTLGRWREEVLALIGHHCQGQVILVGSSMGGWLMLLVALALPAERLAGLIGIAAAPDFTQWGFTAAQKKELVAGRTIYEENPYGPEPTPTHARFWADGERLRLLGDRVPLSCPVRLLHGQDDEVVPPEISMRLAAALGSADVQIMLVKAGDHRLSRETDIALLLATASALVTPP